MADTTKLARWHTVKAEMEVLKEEEMTLRKELFAASFPNPTEGKKDNKEKLDGGYILQGGYSIGRTLDPSVIDSYRAMDNVKPLIDKLIEWTPKLVLKEWKALSPDDKALVADLVIEKPGAPTLDIVKPKR